MNDYLTEENKMALDMEFETFEQNGIELVRLTRKNVAIAESIFKNDSSYFKATNKNAKPKGKYNGSSAYWINRLKKEKPSDYKKCIEKIINSLDNENSTHLNSDGVGRKEIFERIIDNYKDLKSLKNELKKSGYSLYELLSKETNPKGKKSKSGKEYKGRKNPSFASKFCHYLCFNLFSKEGDRDKYPIYDRVIKTSLPLYLNSYGVKKEYDLEDYSQYVEAIDAIIEKTEGMSRNGFDHLVWLFHKGRK